MGGMGLNVGVYGGSGYAGVELVRLLFGHPEVGALRVASRGYAGRGIGSVYPQLAVEGSYVAPEEIEASDLDVAFVAYGHRESAETVRVLLDAGAGLVIDLSADFRLGDAGLYGEWYGEHPAPELLDEAHYGLPEVFGAAEGRLVANPGCYPTAALLALLPLAARGLIDETREVVIDAASGVSGAGRNPKPELLFGEVTENFRAYAAGNEHRHLPELKATLERESGFTGDLVFTPHLLPVKRGILETIHVPLTRVVDRATAEGMYEAVYGAEPCVVVRHGTLPSLQDVVHRNVVAIGVAPVSHVRRPRLTVIAAIDNLVKGAAGQAIQNMNVMLGLPETTGLAC